MRKPSGASRRWRGGRRDDAQHERAVKFDSTQVDRNVISASANALVDGFEFGIVEYADSCMLCEVDYDAPPIYSSDDDEAPSSLQAMPREVRTAR